MADPIVADAKAEVSKVVAWFKALAPHVPTWALLAWAFVKHWL
jgi:hypothetical protein